MMEYINLSKVNRFRTKEVVLVAGEVRFHNTHICNFYEDKDGHYYPSNILEEKMYKRVFGTKLEKFHLSIQSNLMMARHETKLVS